MEQVHPKLVRVALEDVPGSIFEAFGQEFYGAIRGREYIPLGGTHDKGADGYVDVKEQAGGFPTEFVLMSVQEDARAKIRYDVGRLRDVGRQPETVIYLTSRVIKHVDEVEADLSKELGLVVRIRDGRYLADHINESASTRAAFENHLRSQVAFLRHIGKAPLLAKSKYVEAPDVYVFLHQELERNGHSSLVDAVTDALVLWSLEGTDPDRDLFMTREEVIAKIEKIIPSAGTFLHSNRVNNRLQALSSKDHPGGRAVRWHKKDNKYCLPFETRIGIEEENLEDTSLLIDVRDGFVSRIDEQHGTVLTPDEISDAADLCLEAIRRTFEREGLSFARFLAQKPELEARITVSDAVEEALVESEVDGARAAAVGDAVLSALRGAFYQSTEAERLYLSKLSKTFALLFTLRTEPMLVEYFQDMAADFYLYVGSDIIVRALSERYLPAADQMTRNMVEMVRQAGAKLVLAEPVLDEVINHLRASDKEFKNHFQNLESYLKDTTIPQQSEKILVRAYFYARLEPDHHAGSPPSWSGYIQQFCSYGDLHKPAGKSDLLDYLVNQFGLTYASLEEIEKLVDDEKLTALTEEFKSVKKHEALAKNDATMTLAVYGRRDVNKESGSSTEFGYRTWWLTGEGRIVKPAQELLREHGGRRFAMRPEFLLNFISLSPRAAAVREAYRNVFPSLQGIRLGKRLEPDAFDQLMGDVDEAMALEAGRRQAEVSKLVDRLKGDFAKRYMHSLG